VPAGVPSARSSFRLDLASERLWRGSHAIALRPKTFAVLRHLAERPGRLVTKDALLGAVWPDVEVGDGGLTVCVRELRRALGDDARTPRFIETLHRRGYRLIGHIPVTGSQDGFGTRASALGPAISVGRETEADRLHQWLDQVLGGVRQTVFITGEPGLGKTTLVEAFTDAAARREDLWIGRGQCIEHYGAGEAYMPVLDAMGRLCRQPGGEALTALLTRHAPSWLVQMPGLLGDAEMATLQRRAAGTTRERMLRELSEAIEVLTAQKPLVLVLEDLHWCDPSSLDLVALVARRREPARFLFVGTYRPAEVTLRGHRLSVLKQELHAHGLCAEMRLTFLGEASVAEYLKLRFPGSELPATLARFVHHRTEGNPLFMVNMVDDWLAQEWLVEAEGQWTLRAGLDTLAAGVPENLRQLLDRQLDRLSAEEQRVLEVGSVAGVEFSAAAVAAGLNSELLPIDERCAAIARRSHLLQQREEQAWPDGTVAGRYGFVHALYRDMVRTRLTAARRADLHRRIAARMAEGYGPHTGAVAAELAMHFQQGGDHPRAIAYLQQAADTALRRHAHAEAIHHLITALSLLRTAPDSPERRRQELTAQTTLGLAFMATKGFAAPEVEAAYARAWELAQRVGESPQVFSAIRGLWHYHFTRAELERARQLAEQLYRLAEPVQESTPLIEAHRVLGATLFFLNEVSLARIHLEHGISLYDPQRHRTLAFQYGTDPGVACRSFAAWASWLLGYPARALGEIERALMLAHELGHPLSLAHALSFAAIVHRLCGETQAAAAHAEALVALSVEHGFPFRAAMGRVLHGSIMVRQGAKDAGMAQMREGLSAYRATGAALDWPLFLALLAEAHDTRAEVDAGLQFVGEAHSVMRKTGQYVYEADLYRLQGDLFLTRSRRNEAEAEDLLRQSLVVSRRQSTRSLELRAATSLARLWQRQGRREAAYELLAEVYHWFTEGFDTADVQSARMLLEGLRDPNSPPRSSDSSRSVGPGT
jgi:predicted ATPase/DNA-binding winged helix-turn-helix (wHTH) protein